jgi:catechol 2,3-dioxygenase-like lactoylglutathione lyase family enzyme
MFFGVTHVDIPVTDLASAEAFWTGLVGLTVAKRGEGFTDIDSGSLMLRLVQVSRVEHPVSLRVHVYNVQEAYDAALRAGAKPLYAPLRTPALELVASVSGPDDQPLMFWRELTEDEYDFAPELPKEGEWHADAEVLLVSLLSHVPAMFRALARRKVTRIVEEIAGYDRSPVTRAHVIRGYILSSAKITRYRLVEPLRKHGIDPDDYKAEFDA